MNKRIFSVIGILAMLVVLISVGVSAATRLPDYKPVDVGPELRTWEPTMDPIAPSWKEAIVPPRLLPKTILVTWKLKEWLSLNDYTGHYFFTDFYLIAETATSDFGFSQSELPGGDSRPVSQW